MKQGLRYGVSFALNLAKDEDEAIELAWDSLPE